MRKVRVTAFKMTGFMGRRRGSWLTKKAEQQGQSGTAYLLGVAGKPSHTYYLAEDGSLRLTEMRREG